LEDEERRVLREREFALAEQRRLAEEANLLRQQMADLEARLSESLKISNSVVSQPPPSNTTPHQAPPPPPPSISGMFNSSIRYEPNSPTSPPPPQYSRGRYEASPPRREPARRDYAPAPPPRIYQCGGNPTCRNPVEWNFTTNKGKWCPDCVSNYQRGRQGPPPSNNNYYRDNRDHRDYQDHRYRR